MNILSLANKQLNKEALGDINKNGGDSKLSLKQFIKKSISFLSNNKQKENPSGYRSKLAASGNFSQLVASGYYSKLAASGNYSQLVASGYDSTLAASGNYSQLVASGYDSTLAASGYCSKLMASGDGSKLAASGNYSQVALNGKNNVGANIGIQGQIKGVKGNWITLAEYDYENNIICVKAAQIDGERIKENTWYKLKDKKFTEVK